MKWTKVLFQALVLTMLSVSASSAGIIADERETLRGLEGVAVLVSVDCDSPVFTSMVDAGILKAKVELRLRQAGIKVLDKDSIFTSPRWPQLLVNVTAVPDAGVHAFAIELSMALRQVTWIVEMGKPTVPVASKTWDRSGVLNFGLTPLRAGRLAQEVADSEDEFINDWLATHGK